jgi:hypothetical protein
MEVITSLIVQTHGIQPALLTSDTGVRSLPTGVFTTGRPSVAYGEPKPSVTPFEQYRCRSPAIPRAALTLLVLGSSYSAPGWKVTLSPSAARGLEKVGHGLLERGA